MELAGKKALVTGARRRIGRGIAQALAEAGCDVAINDVERDADAEETLSRIRAVGRDTEYYQGDITDCGQVKAMFQAYLSRFGRIDILVNNAYWSQNTPFLEISEEVWDRTLNICLKGYFLCSQEAARAMVRQGDGGSLVAISSVHARRVWPRDTCYGVSKAGILRMVGSMALDLAPYGIRSNAILPGYMDVDHEFGSPLPEPERMDEHLRKYIPTWRRGTPEDIGRAVVFLSSKAGSQINGVTLPIDGGMLVTGVP